MAFEIKSLLPAAIMSSIGKNETTLSGADLFETVQNKWPGPYSVDDILLAVEFLSKVGDVAFLDISDPDELIRINGNNLSVVLRNTEWRSKAPASYNWVNFGDLWLQREWEKVWASPANTEDEAAESGTPASVHSSAWTGIASRPITTQNAPAVRDAIANAISALDEYDLTNEQKGQAVTLLEAASHLTSAPEPPSDLIWELIERAGALCGILGLFITIFALAFG